MDSQIRTRVLLLSQFLSPDSQSGPTDGGWLGVLFRQKLNTASVITDFVFVFVFVLGFCQDFNRN